MKKFYFAFLISTAMISFIACEDIINPALEPADPVLVVDAWINDLPGPQTILLSRTQPYFEATLPPPVSGADVRITDDLGRVFLFVETATKPGTYEWTPSGNDTLRIGGAYTLAIVDGSESFSALSRMGRVPVIDSLTFEEDDNLATGGKLTRAEFWATDPTGPGDAYWIRSWKNGVPLLKPGEINIAFDAGLSVGGPADGVVFIPPVRRRINSTDTDEDGALLSPVNEGDSIHVQMHSITEAAFTYLNEISIQTNRPGGFAELFATPLANVSTNVFNVNPNGSKVVGFFNVSSVSVIGGRYTK